MSSVVSGLHVGKVEAVNEASDVAPFGADHDVVVRLVPEVITEKCFLLSFVGKKGESAISGAL